MEHTPDFGFYRVKYPVQGEPLVSVIIPNREEKETLQACVESIFEKTAYKNYEIIIVENNSSSEEIFRYYRKLSEDPRVHLIRWKKASTILPSTISGCAMPREITCFSE